MTKIVIVPALDIRSARRLFVERTPTIGITAGTGITHSCATATVRQKYRQNLNTSSLSVSQYAAYKLNTCWIHCERLHFQSTGNRTQNREHHILPIQVHSTENVRHASQSFCRRKFTNVPCTSHPRTPHRRGSLRTVKMFRHADTRENSIAGLS
eukprot:SAG31_NODE_1040_length_10203_cov_3.045428_11_plen_154_part_00